MPICNDFVFTKIYDKRDDFDFEIANFPFLDGDAFQGDASFADPFCYFCFTFVFIILSCLFLEALRSPAGKELDTWLYCA